MNERIVLALITLPVLIEGGGINMSEPGIAEPEILDL